MLVPKKILIIQLRRIGDVILTLPVINALRKNFPDAKIDFLTERPQDQFVRLSPQLDETLVYDKRHPFVWIKNLRKRGYDCVLDFHSNGRTLVLTALSGAKWKVGFCGPLTRALAYNLRVEPKAGSYIVDKKLGMLGALGLNVERWNWDLKLPQESMDWADQFLKEAGVAGPPFKLAGIAPCSRRETRRWLPERWVQVLAGIVKRSHSALFLWGPGEQVEIEHLRDQTRALLGPEPSGQGRLIMPPLTNLMQMAALIKRCSFVVCVDNGPMNMAIALETPSLAIFGPTQPLSMSPQNHPVHSMVNDENLFCIACGKNQCPYRHECMQNITSESVLQRLERYLK